MKKSEIRNKHLALRKTWTKEEWNLRNSLMQDNLYTYLSNLPKGALVLSFQSILGKKEVDTKTIHDTLLLPPFEFKLAFPRVEGEGKMSAYLVHEKTSWITSNWGILEPDPDTSEKIEPAEIHVVLVPLIGFDLQGHRVGFGKGFYDRFLSKCQPACLKIGLSLESPVKQIDDLHAFDIPLDVIISSEGLYTFH